MQEFLSIGVIGATLAVVIQFIKTRFGLDSITTKLVTLGLAIVLGAVYFFLSQTEIWQTILGVLASASTVWAFFLKSSE